MLRLRPPGLVLLVASSAAQADQATTLPSSTALVLLTLLASFTVHLWQHPDVLRSPYRKPLILLAGGSVAATLLWSGYGPAHQGLSLAGYTAILTATLFTLNYWIRQTAFHSVKRLLLEQMGEQSGANLTGPAAASAPVPPEQVTTAHHGLTHICQRQHFEQQLQYVWHSARREQQPLSLILLEIDGPPEQESECGTLAAAAAAGSVAALLQDHFQRGCDVLCRFDEHVFAVLLPNTLPGHARELAEQLCRTIARTRLTVDGRRIQLAAWPGVSGLVPQPQDDPLRLLHTAADALSRAKRESRNVHHSAPTGAVPDERPRSQRSSTDR